MLLSVSDCLTVMLNSFQHLKHTESKADPEKLQIPKQVRDDMALDVMVQDNIL